MTWPPAGSDGSAGSAGGAAGGGGYGKAPHVIQVARRGIWSSLEHRTG
jgi:hypothetical protein